MPIILTKLIYFKFVRKLKSGIAESCKLQVMLKSCRSDNSQQVRMSSYEFLAKCSICAVRYLDFD